MTTELVRTNVYEPESLPAAEELATKLVLSGLLGSSIRKPEQALAIIIAGKELGMAPMQALRSMYVIDGKTVMSADLMVALAKRNPECEFFRMVTSTPKIATYEAKRKGDPEPTRLSFTIEEAIMAGVTGKDNWKKYPTAMLRARCSAALARIVFPDLLLGVYDPDELGMIQIKNEEDVVHFEKV